MTFPKKQKSPEKFSDVRMYVREQWRQYPIRSKFRRVKTAKIQHNLKLLNWHTTPQNKVTMLPYPQKKHLVYEGKKLHQFNHGNLTFDSNIQLFGPFWDKIWPDLTILGQKVRLSMLFTEWRYLLSEESMTIWIFRIPYSAIVKSYAKWPLQ